jgi:hypothetical protein
MSASTASVVRISFPTVVIDPEIRNVGQFPLDR